MADPCLLRKFINEELEVILVVHMDDTLDGSNGTAAMKL